MINDAHEFDQGCRSDQSIVNKARPHSNASNLVLCEGVPGKEMDEIWVIGIVNAEQVNEVYTCTCISNMPTGLNDQLVSSRPNALYVIRGTNSAASGDTTRTMIKARKASLKCNS